MARSGVVATFDEAVGLGVIKADDGSEYPFHCTQIADGTRAIPEGTAVQFEPVAGHVGRWEATDIRPGYAGGLPGAGEPAGAAAAFSWT